jgi:hypothetical protein
MCKPKGIKRYRRDIRFSAFEAVEGYVSPEAFLIKINEKIKEEIQDYNKRNGLDFVFLPEHKATFSLEGVDYDDPKVFDVIVTIWEPTEKYMERLEEYTRSLEN